VAVSQPFSSPGAGVIDADRNETGAEPYSVYDLTPDRVAVDIK